MTINRILLVMIFSFGCFTFTSCQDERKDGADEVDLGQFDDDPLSEGEIMVDEPDFEENTVASRIKENPDLATFYGGMERAELDDDFTEGEGPYTIFAPANIAYDELSQAERNQFENVENIDETGAGMHYLVVRGKLTAENLQQQIESANGSLQLTSLQGESLTASMEEGKLVLSDGSGRRAVVQESDIDASNGIVHVVDNVLQPKDLSRNDNLPRDWNPRNDQMNFEEADENYDNN